MTSTLPASPPLAGNFSGPVLLFDGECGLCNRIVRLLLRLDRAGRLRFATLQGLTGQGYLQAHGLPTKDFDSLVFIPAWEQRAQPEYLLRTDGALAALKTSGGLGRGLAAIARVVPRSWRDAAYRGIARWRYRLFGEWKPRPLARPEWAARFLP
jgi:predicted DCC family thiol-disulfide oxidoreductase YuxK